MWLTTTQAESVGIPGSTLRTRAAKDPSTRKHFADGSYAYWCPKPVRGIWGSDVHYECRDERAFQVFMDYARRYDPSHWVHGGDVLDMLSCSGHAATGQEPLFVEDVAQGHEYLDRVKAAAPNAKQTWIDGNHEYRVRRKIAKQAPAFLGAVTLKDHLKLDERGIDYRSFNDMLTIGDIGFVHGVSVAQNHTKVHLTKYLQHIVYGHTHRPMSQWLRLGGKVLQAHGAGCFAELDPIPAWHKPNGPVDWTHGFIVFEIDWAGKSSIYQMIIDQDYQLHDRPEVPPLRA